MKKSVLITVPHAACRNIEVRQCDRRAEYAANLLEQELQKYNIPTILYINRNVERIYYDMNRSSSRNTQWRRKLDQLYKDADFVIDVHSFPEFDENYNPSFILPKAKITILYEDVLEFSIIEAIENVVGNKLAVLQGIHNDIIETAFTAGIENVLLLEVAEENSILSDKELTQVIEAIAKTIAEILNRLIDISFLD